MIRGYCKAKIPTMVFHFSSNGSRMRRNGPPELCFCAQGVRAVLCSFRGGIGSLLGLEDGIW